MGASNGGVAIKTDTSIIDFDKTVKDLFGQDFQKSDSSCDTRNGDCVFIGRTKDFVIIINTDFADQFFEDSSTKHIQRYLDYFQSPSFVFAFEEYDSGGTYSYSLIYDGIVKRQFRSISYETTTDFGEHEPNEVKWKNAETIKEDRSDGELEVLYKDQETNVAYSKDELPQIALSELMIEKLGFTSWNMDEFMLDKKYYKKAPVSIKARSSENGHSIASTETKKPWWKFW